MLGVIDYILSLYPLEWLLYVQKEFDEYGEAGVIIQHPENKEIKLDILITKDRVGIWVIETSKSDVEIDFSGFDYTFEQREIKSLKKFLNHFFENAILDSNCK